MFDFFFFNSHAERVPMGRPKLSSQEQERQTHCLILVTHEFHKKKGIQ